MLEARAWKHVLEIYVVNVGQKFNLNKSKVFFNTELDIQRRVLNILGCNTASLPDTYLRLPLIVKEVSNHFWNIILENMQKKLIGWKGKTLSNVGKLQLLTSFLQGIHVYFISLFKISQAMVEKLEKI